jgi:hypothetical protein
MFIKCIIFSYHVDINDLEDCPEEFLSENLAENCGKQNQIK